MRRDGIAFAAVALLLALALPSAGRADQQTDQQKKEEIQRMHWIAQGDMKFKTSSSALALPKDFRGVAGSDAARLNQILNADDSSTTEGVIVAPDESLVYLQYFDAGFITVDDWADLKADDLLEQVRQNTETGNPARISAGLPALHVDGWLQRPALDRELRRADWAFSAHQEGGPKIINAVAIQLGRSGYEKIIWAGTPEAFNGSSLDAVLRGYSFDGGARYADHTDSDKAAGYGIAALIGAVVGGKAIQVAAGAGFLVLLKKFFFVPLLVAAAFYKKIIAFFKKKPPTMPPAPTGAA
jgi:uncharacterized membrane-anchored protein